MATRGTFVVVGTAVAFAGGLTLTALVFGGTVAGAGWFAASAPEPAPPSPAVIAVAEPVPSMPVGDATPAPAAVEAEPEVEAGTAEAVDDFPHVRRSGSDEPAEEMSDDDLAAEELDALLEDFDPRDMGVITVPVEQVEDKKKGKRRRRSR